MLAATSKSLLTVAPPHVLFALLISAGSAAGQAPNAISFEEVARHRLPAHFVLGGASFHEEEVVVWSSGSRAFCRATIRQLDCSWVDSLPVAFAMDGEHLSYVTRSGEVRRREGAVERGAVGAAGFNVAAAASAAGVWYQLGWDHADLLVRVRSGQADAVYRVTEPTGKQRDGGVIHAHALERAVVFTPSTPASWLLTVDEATGPRLHDLGANEGSADFNDWFAAPLVPLGADYFQQYVDLRSDTVVTVRRPANDATKLLSITRAEGFVVFIASSTSHRLVAATRNLDQYELVLYRWR